ncbi:MAG TPA: hypothetical protein VLH19_03915 [Patescibacteria group bacterium]|nr:hypothetical protein [Patescibacteria group bacterium]
MNVAEQVERIAQRVFDGKTGKKTDHKIAKMMDGVDPDDRADAAHQLIDRLLFDKRVSGAQREEWMNRLVGKLVDSTENLSVDQACYYKSLIASVLERVRVD